VITNNLQYGQFITFATVSLPLAVCIPLPVHLHGIFPSPRAMCQWSIRSSDVEPNLPKLSQDKPESPLAPEATEEPELSLLPPAPLARTAAIRMSAVDHVIGRFVGKKEVAEVRQVQLY
jgi:hypothetical protein